MTDTIAHVANEASAITRHVRRQPINDEPGVALIASRTYPDSPAAVWDALVTPERIGRWLGPISGDLRPGGTFQIEGNAGGQILSCEPAHQIAATWGMGDVFTILYVRLEEHAPGQTTVTLEHVAPAAMTAAWAEAAGISIATGTIGAATGWDEALHALGHELRGAALDRAAWQGSAAQIAFARAIINAWAAAMHTDGYATAEEAAEGAATAAAMFLPPADPGE